MNEWLSIPILFGVIGFLGWYCLKDLTYEQWHGQDNRDVEK